MNSKYDFTTGSIPVKMIKFMLPIFGAQVLQALYSAVDMLIVGQFGTSEGISGVSTGSGLMNLFTFTIVSFSAAVTVLIGKHLGEKRNELIGDLLGGSILLFSIVAIISSILLVVLARPLSILLQAPPEALEETVNYTRICGAGYIFVVAYNLLSSIMRGLGDSKLPLVFVGIACVANIFGDLLLVAVFKMNASGAALATILAQAISVVLSLRIVIKRGFPFEFSKKNLRFGGEIPKVIKIGIPMAVQTMITHVTFLAICAFINGLGLASSSGYGVGNKVQSFIMLIPTSIMQSMAAIVSQNVGAKKERRGLAALRFGCFVGGGIGIFVGLLAFFKGDVIASLFTPEAIVVEKAFEYLRGFAIESVVTCILFSFIGYFNAHEKSLFVLIQGICQSFLIRLPFSYLMAKMHGETLFYIGAAAPLATILGIVICIVYYIRLRKTGAIVLEDPE